MRTVPEPDSPPIEASVYSRLLSGEEPVYCTLGEIEKSLAAAGQAPLRTVMDRNAGCMAILSNRRMGETWSVDRWPPPKDKRIMWDYVLSFDRQRCGYVMKWGRGPVPTLNSGDI